MGTRLFFEIVRQPAAQPAVRERVALARRQGCTAPAALHPTAAVTEHHVPARAESGCGELVECRGRERKRDGGRAATGSAQWSCSVAGRPASRCMGMGKGLEHGPRGLTPRAAPRPGRGVDQHFISIVEPGRAAQGGARGPAPRGPRGPRAGRGGPPSRRPWPRRGSGRAGPGRSTLASDSRSIVPAEPAEPCCQHSGCFIF